MEDILVDLNDVEPHDKAPDLPLNLRSVGANVSKNSTSSLNTPSSIFYTSGTSGCIQTSAKTRSRISNIFSRHRTTIDDNDDDPFDLKSSTSTKSLNGLIDNEINKSASPTIGVKTGVLISIAEESPQKTGFGALTDWDTLKFEAHAIVGDIQLSTKTSKKKNYRLEASNSFDFPFHSPTYSADTEKSILKLSESEDNEDIIDLKVSRCYQYPSDKENYSPGSNNIPPVKLLDFSACEISDYENDLYVKDLVTNVSETTRRTIVTNGPDVTNSRASILDSRSSLLSKPPMPRLSTSFVKQPNKTVKINGLHTILPKSGQAMAVRSGQATSRRSLSLQANHRSDRTRMLPTQTSKQILPSKQNNAISGRLDHMSKTKSNNSSGPLSKSAQTKPNMTSKIPTSPKLSSSIQSNKLQPYNSVIAKVSCVGSTSNVSNYNQKRSTAISTGSKPVIKSYANPRAVSKQSNGVQGGDISNTVKNKVVPTLKSNLVPNSKLRSRVCSSKTTKSNLNDKRQEESCQKNEKIGNGKISTLNTKFNHGATYDLTECITELKSNEKKTSKIDAKGQISQFRKVKTVPVIAPTRRELQGTKGSDKLVAVGLGNRLENTSVQKRRSVIPQPHGHAGSKLSGSNSAFNWK